MESMPPEFDFDPGRFFTFNAYVLSGACVLFYDWLITIDVEWDRIWGRKWSAFTLFWFLVRYFPMCGRIAVEAMSYTAMQAWTTNTCPTFVWLDSAVNTFSVVLAHMSFIVRVYALYNRRAAAIVLPALIWIGEIGLGLYPIIWGASHSDQLGFACWEDLWTTPVSTAVTAVSICFDLSTLLLVVGRCVWFVRHHRSSPLVRVLIRDGVGYFAVVFGCNTLNIVLISSQQSFVQACTVMLSLIIPTLMSNRMILSIRSVEPEPVLPTQSFNYKSATVLTLPSAVFHNIVDEFVGHDHSSGLVTETSHEWTGDAS